MCLTTLNATNDFEIEIGRDYINNDFDDVNIENQEEETQEETDVQFE